MKLAAAMKEIANRKQAELKDEQAELQRLIERDKTRWRLKYPVETIIGRLEECVLDNVRKAAELGGYQSRTRLMNFYYGIGAQSDWLTDNERLDIGHEILTRLSLHGFEASIWYGGDNPILEVNW